MSASRLAVARMFYLARAYHHGWAAKFDQYNPPTTMEQALAAHKEAQEADEDHKIVIPSLTHTTGSGRTSWRIDDDGTVIAKIRDVEFRGFDEGAVVSAPRVVIFIRPDGSDQITHYPDNQAVHYEKAVKVWRAVFGVVAEVKTVDCDPEVAVRIYR